MLFLTSIGSTISAQEEGLADLQKLSIEELLNIVVTASKQEERISEAPAIIDIITSDFIEDVKAENLYDLISLLPGIEKFETYWGRSLLNFRGVQNIHYNHKTLLMINGTPHYEPILGTYFLEQIPVSSIERIEVIKGPGSSLYGSNAYSGVINIITKSPQQNEGVFVTGGYGSYNRYRLGFSAGLQTGELGILLSGYLEDSDGLPYKIESDETGQSRDLDFHFNPSTIMMNLNYKDVQLEAGILHMHRTLFGITYNLDYTGFHHYVTYFSNLRYNFKLNNADGLLTVHYNKFDNPESSIGYFPFKGFTDHEISTTELTKNSDNVSTEFQFNVPVSENLSHVGGITYKYYKSSPYLFVWSSDHARHPATSYDIEPSSYTMAAYSQFTYRYSDWIFTAGLRIVKDKDITKAFFLPRAGIVYNLNNFSSIKLLYGKAFRSPTFFEKYVDTDNVLFGRIDLAAEKIQTFDMGYEYVNKKRRFRINTFYELTSDGIIRVPTEMPEIQGPNAVVYTNVAEHRIYGLEVFYKDKLSDNGHWGINATLKKGKFNEKNGDEELLGNAHFNFNSWMNIKLENFYFTLIGQYIGERDGFSHRIVNEEYVGDFLIDGYLLADLIVGYKYNAFDFSIITRNLFDKEYTYPEYIRTLSEELPGSAGRLFELRIDYKFQY